MKRRVLFRAEANKTIGRGHLSRCLAIANMLENEFEILFVSNIENKSYIENLSIPYRFEAILSDANFIDFVNQEDIVWLDGYKFDESFKMHLRSHVFKLIETNDLPYKVENVDLLFNQTPGLKEEQFKVVDSRAKIYLGLNYALLRSAFLEKAKNYQELLDGSGVFVCFGGADTNNLGLKFVTNLVNTGFDNPIYWVTKSQEESNKYNFNENVHLLNSLNEAEMIQYMSASKVILIPSSVLSFEAMALRKPIFTGYFVENQELIYKGLLEQGLAEGAGYLETDEHVSIATQSFLSFYSNDKKHSNQRENQEKAIDGLSGERIKNILYKN
jgi:spore coat polysaccharide biosynthesis predicted glycosyltransferase SpsG